MASVAPEVDNDNYLQILDQEGALFDITAIAQRWGAPVTTWISHDLFGSFEDSSRDLAIGQFLQALIAQAKRTAGNPSKVEINDYRIGTRTCTVVLDLVFDLGFRPGPCLLIAEAKHLEYSEN
jgi:hypothetical protein